MAPAQLPVLPVPEPCGAALWLGRKVLTGTSALTQVLLLL